LPLVTYTASKPTPGFFIADVILGVELNVNTVAAFLRKITMLTGLRKTRPFVPMLIADSFTLDALKLCRAKGIIATRPETLFGQDVAHALEDLLHTLPGLHPRRRMTMRLFHFIRENAAKHTFTDVARLVGLDDRTIRNVVGEKDGKA
jgi:hypothetical protein